MNSRRDILQIKVTLKDIRPVVWRRIEVVASGTFWDLHVAIQDAMGWTDSHLHQFSIRDGQETIDEVGIPDDEWFGGDPVVRAGWKVRLAEYFDHVGARALYDYDFGDGWSHEVRVEAVRARAPKTQYPRCTGGARACPPEDCGGVGGYARLLDIMADPKHEEQESMLEWLGGPIDPNEFDASEVRFDDPKERKKLMLEGF